MAKKIFVVLLIILVLMAVYSIYQKKNPAGNQLSNVPKEETGQQTGSVNQPSPSGQPSGTSQGIFLEVTKPANNATVGSTQVTVAGKTISGGAVSVNDQDLKADVNGNFSTTVTISEGQNDIFIVASDDLGNSVEKDITVNLESTN